MDGVTTEQVWVNGQIVMDKCGESVVKYTYGSKLVESDYGWYSYDAHGNVTMLTDDTGAVIKRYDYDPYGVELGEEDSTDENPFRYSGQYTDRETGYVYLRARYYDPALGRFLSMDLMMDGANWYIYCAGNPVRFVDPSGFTSEEYAQYLSSYKPKMRGSFNSSMDYMEYMRQNTAQKITETPVRVRPRGSYANSAEYAQFLKDSSPEAPDIPMRTNNKLYNHEVDLVKKITQVKSEFNTDFDKFKQIYSENESTYKSISRQVNLPPELVASIHYRESGCNFNTYMHNGDPLGRPTTHVPRGIYFDNFEEAAIDALSNDYLNNLKDSFSLSSNSTDIYAMLAFSESYNGLGYYNKGLVSPYVYSGTNVYQSGKYVSDGRYDSGYVDKQPGIYALISAIR